MKLIRKYGFEIAVLVPIIILVIIKSAEVNHFKNDAKRWAEPSVARLNTITPEQVRNLHGNNLTINLDKKIIPGEKITGDLKNIPADSIISKKIIKSILKHNGPVLIYSSQSALSARIWMVLSQMGCKKIFILTDQPDNESLKYKFRPDTIVH